MNMDDPSVVALTRTIAGTGTLKLLELSASDVFYTPIERRFESITRLARRSLRVPVAAVTGVDHLEQWFKAVAGWSVSRIPLDMTPCQFTVSEGRALVAADLSEDHRFSHLPLVVGKPRFRFYAGTPLRNCAGVTIGTFCVFDLRSRKFGLEDQRVFEDLASTAQREIHAVEAGTAYSSLISKLGTARREALLDPLTRVWNRRGAEAILREFTHKQRQETLMLSICMVDVDRFKQINDRCGHQAGDQVLRTIAKRLVDCFRDEDIVCRFGGDEFLVMLPYTDKVRARELAKKLVREMATDPIPVRTTAVPVTVSVGCASLEPGMVPLELIEAADRALLGSKASGRNRVAIASDLISRNF